MEESEKRRERLNAMRMEAAQTGVYTNSESPGSASNALSNPLVENETASGPPHQYTTRRFDFYTDPMSAFTGSKRRNNVAPQVSQGHYNPPPPRPMGQGMIPNPAYHYPAMNSPGQNMFNQPIAHFNPRPVGSPMGPLNMPHQNPPSSWGGSVNYGPPPNFPRGGYFPGPGFRQGDSPFVDYGQGGRGHQGQNNNFQHDSGRGPGRGRSYGGNSTSSGSAPGFRRGSGSLDSVSAEQRPDMYYMKEMVVDPWMSMQPIILKGSTSDSISDRSWLPKSIAVKKSKASPEASKTSIPQQSLAEYLAATFSDSVDEAPNFVSSNCLIVFCCTANCQVESPSFSQAFPFYLFILFFTAVCGSILLKKKSATSDIIIDATSFYTQKNVIRMFNGPKDLKRICGNNFK